jgi:hypothetical protein
MTAAPSLARPKRSSALGIVVFFATVAAYLAIPAIVRAADGVPSLVVTTVVFGGLAAAGIVAAVLRRGRAWAIAAIVVALANSSSPLHLAITELVTSIFG